MHRIGRTARAGKSGRSLIYLNTPEESYLQYLETKGVVIKELKSNKGTSPSNSKDVYSELKQHMLKDRDLIDKAQNAFVSFIRYYKEHRLQFIFSSTSLEIGQVANSFALFSIPRVKEILGKSIKGFEGEKIDLAAVPYIDKNKEKQKMEVQKKRMEKFEEKELKKQEMKEKEKVVK